LKLNCKISKWRNYIIYFTFLLKKLIFISCILKYYFLLIMNSCKKFLKLDQTDSISLFLRLCLDLGIIASPSIHLVAVRRCLLQGILQGLTLIFSPFISSFSHFSLLENVFYHHYNPLFFIILFSQQTFCFLIGWS